MKRIRDAYHQGMSGEKPASKSRVLRLAHAAGRRSMESAVRANESAEAGQAAALQEAIDVAKGANVQALSVIQTAARIPKPNSRPITTFDTLNKVTGARTREWHLILNTNPDPQTADGDKLPVGTLLTESPGTLSVDNINWNHPGLTARVDSLTIVCSAPIDEAGKLSGAPSTLLCINQPRNKFSEDVAIDDNRMTGAAWLHIDTMGAEDIELERRNGGFSPEDPKTTFMDMPALLNGVQFAVEQTAQDYQVPSPDQFGQ